MKKLSKVLLKAAGIGIGLFAALFAVYFFNLDMKLTAKMEPVLFYFYDRVHIQQSLLLYSLQLSIGLDYMPIYVSFH